MTTPEVKLCVDCVYHEDFPARFHSDAHMCKAKAFKTVDVVTGQINEVGIVNCWEQRSAKGECRPEGILYAKDWEKDDNKR